MEIVKSIEDISSLVNNKIIFKDENSSLTLNNSKITFSASGCILYIDGKVTLEGSEIVFDADCGLAYIPQSTHPYRIQAFIRNGCTLHFGKNCYFNGTVKIILSEGKHFFTGEDVLFSYGIVARVADPHLIYDCNTHKRINLSESIYLGDHVWIGQDVLIMKGAKIGSGSIIGAKSLVTKKTIPSNESWGGVPCKCIRKDVFYLNSCVHFWTKNETNSSLEKGTNAFIYSKDKSTLCFEDIDKFLCKNLDPQKRLDYILKFEESAKNKFYIAPSFNEAPKSTQSLKSSKKRRFLWFK